MTRPIPTKKAASIGTTTSPTGVEPWESLTEAGRTLRMLELILIGLDDPDHPLRIADPNPSYQRSVSSALERAINLIRDAGVHFAEGNKIVIPYLSTLKGPSNPATSPRPKVARH